MGSADDTKRDGERSPLFKAGALVAILVVLCGGGWASLAPAGSFGPSASRAGSELETMIRDLDPKAVASRGVAETSAAAEGLVRASRLAGIDPREALFAAMPEPREILGMLALDRDVEDFLDYAELRGAAGDFYSAEARAARELRPLRARYEAAFSAAYAALGGAAPAEATAMRAATRPAAAIVPATDSGAGKKPYLASPGEVWLPPKRDLALSHPYALDVFFTRVEKAGGVERGPTIHALYQGIVVAAARDWSGGGTIASWKSGGLSPAAGNGVVIYDPASRRYCSYFHLSSTALRLGDIVVGGAEIGRGGNTGVNARKNGHGEHLHIEIFDAARGESLSAYEILEILKR